MSEFNIDPEAINRYVSQKILESALGDTLRKAIDEKIKTMAGYGVENPIRHHVDQAFGEQIREYLNTPDIKAKIRKAVEERMTDEFLNNLFDKIKVGERNF